jgi:hypothetical protein
MADSPRLREVHSGCIPPGQEFFIEHEVSHLAFNVAREKARLHTEFWEMFFRMLACSGSLVEILRAAARARRAAGKPSTHGDMEWRSIWASSFLTFFSTSSPAGNDRLTGILEEDCNLMNLSFAPPLLHRGTPNLLAHQYCMLGVLS